MKRHLRIAVMNSMRGYFAKVMRGIQKYARPAKPWIIHFFPPEPGAVKAIAAWKPDGILAHFATEDDARTFCALGKPIVNYGFKLKPRRLVAHLGQDDDAIGVMAANYFLQRGFRTFAYIGEESKTFARHRGEGFARTVQAAGHACHWYREQSVARTRSEDPWTARDDFIRRWVLSLPRPAAVLACNDTWGWHISEICLTAGVQIPEQLALMGVDNDELLCEMAYPPLSSVDTRAERIGYRAAAILDGLMSGGKSPRDSIIFEPQRIVTRGSSDSLAIDDPDVVAAVRFIRDNIEKPLSVEWIVERVAISRRTLERKFLQALRRTPLEEIHRTRIERAKTLLGESDLPLPALITSCGFHDRQRFSALFKRSTGMTATQYRKQMRSKE